MMKQSHKILVGTACGMVFCLAIYGVWHFLASPSSHTPAEDKKAETLKKDDAASNSNQSPLVKQDEPTPQPQVDEEAIAEEKADRASPQMADPMFGKDPYANAPVVAQRDTPPDSQGRFQRIKVIQTDFKYPLLRVVQTLSRDPQTGTESVVGQETMVADHVIVKLQPNITEEAFHALNQKYGATIQKKMLAPDTYIVGFNGQDVDALPNIIQNYTQEAEHISYVEPDYIVRAMEGSGGKTQMGIGIK